MLLLERSAPGSNTQSYVFYKGDPEDLDHLLKMRLMWVSRTPDEEDIMSQNNHAHFQQIQGNFIVVIHPGSETLRIGRAPDTQPMSVPHVIARRHRQAGQSPYEDQCLLRDGLNVCLLSFTH